MRPKEALKFLATHIIPSQSSRSQASRSMCKVLG